MSDLYVVALGARTPVGLSAIESAAAIRAGVSRLRIEETWLDEAGEPITCALDPLLPPSAPCLERLGSMSLSVGLEVLRALGPSPAMRLDVPTFFAVAEDRPGFEAHDANDLEQALRDTAAHVGNRYLDWHLVAEGHAGFAVALQRARDALTSGRAELCLVGGADSYFHPDSLAWLDDERRLAREGVRSGFPPGEAAAMLAVTTASVRRRLELPLLAVIRGVATDRELRSPDDPAGTLGEGLGRAVQAATAYLAPSDRATDLYGDLNGERHRTEDWGFTLLRRGGMFRDGSDVTTSVGECGETGAATLPLHCILAARAWARGYAAGPLALLWAGSWSGLRGVIVMQEPSVADR